MRRASVSDDAQRTSTRDDACGDRVLQLSDKCGHACRRKATRNFAASE
jgi:hypothetical protein